MLAYIIINISRPECGRIISYVIRDIFRLKRCTMYTIIYYDLYADITDIIASCAPEKT